MKIHRLIFCVMLTPSVALACGKSADPETVVQAQVEAYNRHDLDGFVACYADNAMIVDLAGKQPPVKTAAELKTAYGFLARVPKEFRVEILKRTVNGPVVVDLERIHGLPKDRPAPPNALVVYEVRDGKILHVWFPPTP